MSITYQCGQCGRWETVRDGKAGSRARCGDCGHEAMVPNLPDLFDDAIDGPRGGAGAPVRRASATRVATPVEAPRKAGATEPESEPSGGSWWGGLWGAGFLVFLVLKLVGLSPFFHARPRPARGPRPAPAAIARPDLGDLTGPVVLPARFPDLGPPRAIAPGVAFHEIKLRPEPNTRPIPPGHAGTLWLYLPTEAEAGAGAEIAPRSLPCVLIAPAGSDAKTGMKLAEGDRPEHLPYVRAGFAVLAFDLDGADSNPDAPAPANLTAFLRARAGLVNARIAQAFLLAKVPAVDPNRLYVAGHSSAGTLALLLAEHEPSLKGCVAFAPLVDLAAHFGARGAWAIRRMGYTDLLTRFSPRSNEARLDCPLLLFQARDDENVKFEETVAFAERLDALKKPVTLDLIDTGGHYQSMLDEGIPRALAWLKARDAEVVHPRPK